MTKICVIGAGYVGMSLSVLLAIKNEVTVLEINNERVKLINERKSPITDKEISEYLATKQLNLKATDNAAKALSGAEFVIIATPTNYDPKLNYFDVSSVLSSIDSVLKFAPDAQIIVKSTLPVGFTEETAAKLKLHTLHFSPEFLREGLALYDNLHPSRIIVGTHNDAVGRTFANLLKESSLKRTCRFLSFPQPRLKASNFFPILILLCVFPSLTSLILMQPKKDLTPNPSLKAYVLTRVSETFTTILPSATADIVCLKTPNSCLPILSTYLTVLLKP